MSTTVAPPQPTRPARPAIPRGFAALIGLLAVGAAIGTGSLVAAVVAPVSSPFLAVGDTVIRFSPQFLTEFAKHTFGTADKPVLLGGMAVVIALLAAVAGLLSRERPQPGVTFVTVLGVIGFLAVAFSPAFAPLDLVAPVASLLVGIVVFRRLHALALRTYDPPARLGGRTAQLSRRKVLIGTSAAVGAGALAAGGGGFLLAGGVGESRVKATSQLGSATLAERAPAIPAGAAFPQLGTPTFLTSNADFYRIDVALRVPTVAATDWRMRIHGMVDKDITLTYADLLARPLVERNITMSCVSNPVGGDLISTATFVGVELADILREAGIKPGADQVYTTSYDPLFSAGTPLDVIMEKDRGALLAIGMNGESLPPEHGFPVRMVVPGLYGFVSATKWISDMELTTFGAKQAYWLQRGWSQKAPIKTQARIDRPQGLSSVPAGKVVAAGIAWAQPVGVGKVEVRMDGGPWQDAVLADEVNHDTWRMWKAEFALAPGSHTLQARTTDRNGVTQTEVRTEPIPDGASGWPATIFNVA